MGVGDAHQFEQALHAAILAPAAMQRIEHSIRLCGREPRRQIVGRIDLDDIEAFFAQRVRASPPRHEADFALRRTAAKKYCDAC